MDATCFIQISIHGIIFLKLNLNVSRKLGTHHNQLEGFTTFNGAVFILSILKTTVNSYRWLKYIYNAKNTYILWVFF